MSEPRMKRDQRIVHRRIIIRGDLVLQTATHLGDGDSEGPTDMSLLGDGREPNKVLLAGASIAGALRSYLREHEHGIFAEEQANGLAETLFGGRKGEDQGYQSPLIINDAIANPSTYELRDGVKISSQTRTAVDRAKYDLELIGAGTTFPLLFELAFAYQLDQAGERKPSHEQQQYEQALLVTLATALKGLAGGEIALGMKKRRGFGRCRIAEWQVWDFNLTNQTDLFAWLAFDQSASSVAGVAHPAGSDISTLLGQTVALPADARQKLTLEATFALEGSLLIRSGQDAATLVPDVRHLHARQPDGKPQPIISGTSLAGVLRHRTERIANTLVANSGAAFANHMFGFVDEQNRNAKASRLIVHEAVVTDAITDLVQNRVSIDRFTGGALDGALFNAQPVFARQKTHVTLRLELLQPDKGEKAMLLLLLKDLWTGDLPIGGESSIGRGRLRGLNAKLHANNTLIAEFNADGTRVMLAHGDRADLNTLVAKLPAALQKEPDHATP